MNKITIVRIKELKAHEKIDQKNLKKVRWRIFSSACLRNPIIVEAKHYVILDGHHRVQALSDLGYSKIPAVLVNYYNEKIKVAARRKNIKISKEKIIERALANTPYPYKTTKHFIPDRPKFINMDLNKLV